MADFFDGIGWGDVLGAAGGMFLGPLGSVGGRALGNAIGRAGTDSAAAKADAAQFGIGQSEGSYFQAGDFNGLGPAAVQWYNQNQAQEAQAEAQGMATAGVTEMNAANAQQAALNREFQADQTRLNRDFQERMSNTSYQRAVGDMQAAGLNPMLAYSQGGASSPAGNVAGGAQAVMQDRLGAGVNTGMRALEVRTMLDKIRADTSLTQSQAALNAVMIPKIQQDTATGYASAAQLRQGTSNMEVEARQMEANIRLAIEHTREAISRTGESSARGHLASVQSELVQLQKTLTRSEIDYRDGEITKQAYEYKLMEAQNVLMRLGIPHAAAESWKSGTWMGKYVAPWWRELTGGASGAAAALGIGVGVGRTVNHIHRREE